MPFKETNALSGYSILSRRPVSYRWELLVRFTIIIALGIVFYWSITGGIFQPLIIALKSSQWASLFVRPSMIWGSMGILLLSFRTVLWFGYKKFPSAGIADAPSLTVIIPAYNEGAMVENTIESVVSACYPKDRLEIFVVDDGSKDDTWHYIQAAAMRYPHLVTTVRFPENRGKRAALEAGFRKACGEIVVTIDSDSVIEPQTLLAIVGPFKNQSVGAVAGKVVVYNRHEGIIPRMLHVRFILSFDFLRAVQSTYGTVYCCPGALAAYRTSVVRKVLVPWMNQTFLGRPCTYGEDRSMTNFILEQGFDTVYQRSSVVHTNAPTTYTRLCKMYLRWDRSYIKEEIRFARIVWTRPLRSRVIAIIDKVITNLRYPVNYAILALLVSMLIYDPHTIIRLLFAIGLLSSLNILYYLHSERSWDFVYGILYSYFAFFALFWIFPVAIITVRSRSWMTRG
ncbi:MAG: glycosyltransferase [Desulfuromonadaceae bacterium]|nr:glycosyltransferase [Desulfuromonadaceae bacterium]